MITRLFIITLLMTACATNPNEKKQAYNHFKIGVTKVNEGQYGAGLEQLLAANRLNPDDALILNHLGLAYFFLKEYEHAIVNFKKALDIKPAYSEVHNNLGRAYLEIMDFRLARKHLSIAASDLTYKQKDKVWVNIGLTYFMQNQFKTAEKYFLKAISVNRANCLAYNYFGRTQIELEKYKKANKALDQAVYHCRKTGFDEPHYYGAISLFRMGYKSKAIARLQEGRRLYPNGPNKKKIEEMINLMRITETK